MHIGICCKVFGIILEQRVSAITQFTYRKEILMDYNSYADVCHDILANKIGEKIYTLRSRRGLTQERLAELVGVSTKTISYWERNIRRLSIEHLMILSMVLEAKTDDILCLPAEDVFSDLTILHSSYLVRDDTELAVFYQHVAGL